MMLQLNKKAKGFTLIELLVAVGIISILSAVALPAYYDYVKRANRSDAKSAIEQLASALERHHTTNGSYTGTHSGGVPLTTFFPSQIPIESDNKLYNLTLSTTAHTYTITATPITGTGMADDGTLTLDYRGIKTHDGNDGWNK